MMDVVFIVVFLGLMLIPFTIFAVKKKQGFIYWVGTVAFMGVCLGIGELTSKLITGKTLSSNFWAFSLDDPGSAIAIIGCMAIAWLLLLIHLSWKMLKRWLEK